MPSQSSHSGSLGIGNISFSPHPFWALFSKREDQRLPTAQWGFQEMDVSSPLDQAPRLSKGQITVSASAGLVGNLSCLELQGVGAGSPLTRADHRAEAL